MRFSCFAFGFALMACAASAQAECKGMAQDGNTYTVCEVDPQLDRLSLFDADVSGKPYGGFSNLVTALSIQGKSLSFAMNAGMFGTDLKPIGLYVENGKQLHRVNRAGGAGNFHLKPNGIFYVAGGKAGVMETDAYLRSGIKPDLATQSGPMLLINGAVHPKISPDGISAKIRNGVCVNDAGKIEFVISESSVTFYQFATMFRDGLRCKNALFLDGSVSSLYAPELGRNDYLAIIGPMLGVTSPAK